MVLILFVYLDVDQPHLKGTDEIIVIMLSHSATL